MNNITIVGNIGTVKVFNNQDSGNVTTKFNVTDSYKKQDGEYEKVFFSCTIFGKRGETIEKWFESGAPISLSGSIKGISERTGDDGRVYKSISVIVSDFSFMPRDFSESNKSSHRPNSNQAEELVF